MLLVPIKGLIVRNYYALKSNSLKLLFISYLSTKFLYYFSISRLNEMSYRLVLQSKTASQKWKFFAFDTFFWRRYKIDAVRRTTRR